MHASLCSSFLVDFYNWKEAEADRKLTAIRMTGVHIPSGFTWRTVCSERQLRFLEVCQPERSRFQAQTVPFSYLLGYEFL